MPEKLPLPKEWYKNWDLDRTASQPSSASNADSLDTEESESCRHKLIKTALVLMSSQCTA